MLGGEVVFAIERFGTRVAQVRLVEAGPGLVLAEHLEGEAAIPVHRVDDLGAALAELERRGAEIEARFEIPPGECASLRIPGGQRLAVYELTRPERLASIEGRFDFRPSA